MILAITISLALNIFCIYHICDLQKVVDVMIDSLEKIVVIVEHDNA